MPSYGGRIYIVHQDHKGKATKVRFNLDGQKFKKPCIESNDSLYIELENNTGLKIIKDNKERYGTLEEASDNLKYFKNKDLDIFPKIIEENIDNETLLLKVEHIKKEKKDFKPPTWVPERDHKFIKKKLQAPLPVLDRLNNAFIKEHIFPEDEWCKKGNIVNDKIVDFHRFKINKDRYVIPTEAKPEDCKKIYKNGLKRYAGRGDDKWKGKIYQGHNFSNGVIFKGYSSDEKVFDSYKKLNFCYLNKAKGKKVLDLGCNEGFFSTQASLAGAESVTSIDLCKEDIQLASEIRDEITGLKNIEYIEGDAVDFVKNDKNKYGLTFLSSVLHQIYPNTKGSEEFIQNIADKTDYLCFESTANHKLMNISLQEINEFFLVFFHGVRLLYLYDSYSSGYRVIFSCWEPR